MPNSFLMTMQFKNQGKIRGSSTKKEGSLDYSKGMECHAFEYGIEVQYDLEAGLSKGKKHHPPIVVTKGKDMASPSVFQACCTGESFTIAVLTVPKATPHGNSFVYHTIELTNGTISSIKPGKIHNGKSSESVSLTYEGLKVNGAPSERVPFDLLRHFA
jgi:type VI secretion system secreted protein Hcp